MQEIPESYLLSSERAKQAIDMVLPAIREAMESDLLKRRHLHIVIMNPATPPHMVENGEEAILCEYSLGLPAKWENDYKSIARAKAIASWRTGQPTHALRETMPYLMVANEEHADSPYFGSAVLLGMVVAASGVQPWFDEWISYMVAAACRALCIAAMQEDIIPDKRRDFIWEPGLDGDGEDGR